MLHKIQIPGYGEPGFWLSDWDLALVTLDKPFKIDLQYVNPICLPYHSRIQWDLPIWQNEEYTVTGMTIAIVPSIVCLISYSEYKIFRIWTI